MSDPSWMDIESPPDIELPPWMLTHDTSEGFRTTLLTGATIDKDGDVTYRRTPSEKYNTEEFEKYAVVQIGVYAAVPDSVLESLFYILTDFCGTDFDPVHFDIVEHRALRAKVKVTGASFTDPLALAHRLMLSPMAPCTDVAMFSSGLLGVEFKTWELIRAEFIAGKAKMHAAQRYTNLLDSLPKSETEAPKPAKTAVLKGASLDVWRIMEEKRRLPIDKLVALAVKKKPVPDKGKDRRAEYARTAINSLVEQGALSLSDDQTEVFI